MTKTARREFARCGRLSWLLLGTFPVSFCAVPEPTAVEVATVLAAADVLEVAGAEASLLAMQFDATPASVTEFEAAARAAANLQRLLMPAGCATIKVEDHVVSATLAGCTGPYGLPILSGQLSTAFAVLPRQDGGSELQVCQAATQLGIGAATADLLTFATVAADRSMAFDSMNSGRGARGFEFHRQGKYLLTWNASCRTLDGEWQNTVAERSFRSTVQGFTQCAARCPQSGSLTVDSSDLTGPLTVSYSGESAATWSTSQSQGNSLDLACEP